jgi:hypothetical protein
MDEDGKLINHEMDGEVPRPFTPEEISQSSFELSRLNSEMLNPNNYTDDDGEPKNMVSLDDDGYFDGGWKEWWNAGSKLGLLEMPGVRNIYGARRWDAFMRGKPSDRIKPSEALNMQSSAGKRVWDNLGGEAVNKPAPQSRLEQIRDKTYIENLNQENLEKIRPLRQSRLRAAFDKAQIMLNQHGIRSLVNDQGKPRTSPITRLNQYFTGTDEETLIYNNVVDMMYDIADNNPEFGIKREEVDTWAKAKDVQRQMEGDPRSVQAYEEGGPDYVRPRTPQRRPSGQTAQPQAPQPEQQIINPTLYGPEGNVISPPDPIEVQRQQRQEQLNIPPEQV